VREVPTASRFLKLNGIWKATTEGKKNATACAVGTSENNNDTNKVVASAMGNTPQGANQGGNAKSRRKVLREGQFQKNADTASQAAEAKHDSNAPAESVRPMGMLCQKHRVFGWRAYSCGGGGCVWDQIQDPWGQKRGMPPIQVQIPGQENRGSGRGGYAGRRPDYRNQQGSHRNDQRYNAPVQGGNMFPVNRENNEAGSTSRDERSGNGTAAPSATTTGTSSRQ
jgi:hypothetical protein